MGTNGYYVSVINLFTTCYIVLLKVVGESKMAPPTKQTNSTCIPNLLLSRQSLQVATTKFILPSKIFR